MVSQFLQMRSLQEDMDRSMVLHVRRRLPTLRRAARVACENLTELIEEDGKEFVAIRSPDTAEDDPDYREVGRFPTREKAEEFLASVDAT